jgi:hypothetical protein
MTEQAVDEVFAFLNGKIDQATLDLRPIKKNLDDNGVEAIRQILEKQPDCTPEQLQNVIAELSSPLPGKVEVFCHLPKDVFENLRPRLQNSLQVEIAKTPDRFPMLNKDIDLTTLKLTRFIIYLSLLVPLLFLILMTLLVVRSLSEWLVWWGIPFVSAGGLLTILALICVFSTRMLLAYAVGPTAYANSFVLAGVDIIQAIVTQIAQPVGIAGCMLLAIGTGMLIYRHFFLNNQEQDEALLKGSAVP